VVFEIKLRIDSNSPTKPKGSKALPRRRVRIVLLEPAFIDARGRGNSKGKFMATDNFDALLALSSLQHPQSWLTSDWSSPRSGLLRREAEANVIRRPLTVRVTKLGP
jgi:hypothetical protein